MSVKIKKVVCLVILSSLAVACSTTSSTTKKDPSISVPKSKTTLIDNKGAAFGISTPEWVELAVVGASKVATLYPNKVAFVQEEIGSNQKLLAMKGSTTGVNAQFASVVATAIIANYKSVADASGEEFNENAYRNTIEAGAKAQFSGLVKESDWWILVDVNGKQEYRYYFLYLMDEKLFAEQVVALAKDSAKKLDNPELAEAVERDVKSTVDLFNKVQDK